MIEVSSGCTTMLGTVALVERLLARIEGLIGVPAGTLKAKMLYEEGIAGRYLPAIAWTFRRRLLGTNVGRWDYLGSLIEMWKDDPAGVFPDPQSVGMATPNMIAYQRYNALLMTMAGMKGGELVNASPIGGMAAVMIYQAGDPYGRARANPLALRAMVIDKLRERLIGLMFVPAGPRPGGEAPTLADCCLVPQIFNAQRFDCRLDDLPHVMRIFESCMALPAFQGVMRTNWSPRISALKVQPTPQ